MSFARLPAALVADAALKAHLKLAARAAELPFGSVTQDAAEHAQLLAQLATAAELGDGFMTVTVQDFALIGGEYRVGQSVPTSVG